MLEIKEESKVEATGGVWGIALVDGSFISTDWGVPVLLLIAIAF